MHAVISISEPDIKFSVSFDGQKESGKQRRATPSFEGWCSNMVVGVNLLGEEEEGEYSPGMFDESLYRKFSYQKSRGMDISFEVRFYLLKQEKTITYF